MFPAPDPVGLLRAHGTPTLITALSVFSAGIWGMRQLDACQGAACTGGQWCSLALIAAGTLGAIRALWRAIRASAQEPAAHPGGMR